MRIPHQYIELLLKGDDDTASLMLDSEWIDIHDDDGKTLFIHSIEQNLPKLYASLRAHECDINLAELNTMRTPLMFACMKQENDFLPRLLEEDSLDLNARDSEGNNAFFYAAFWGNLSALVLLENKVPELAHIPNRRDEIPIEYTIREHRDEAFSLFLAMDGIPDNKLADLIHLSAEVNAWKQAEDLIGRYPEAKMKEKEGFFPIHRAVISGNLKWVQKALDAEIYDVNLADTFENTLLHYAGALGFSEIIRVLLENGADLTLKNNEGKTVREYVTDEETLKLLEIK